MRKKASPENFFGEKLSLFRLNWNASIKTVLEHLKKKDLAPATLEDLIAYWNFLCHQDRERNYNPKFAPGSSIVALGSIWCRDKDSLYYPFIKFHNDPSVRSLEITIHFSSYSFDKSDCYFLAVHKNPKAKKLK